MNNINPILRFGIFVALAVMFLPSQLRAQESDKTPLTLRCLEAKANATSPIDFFSTKAAKEVIDCSFKAFKSRDTSYRCEVQLNQRTSIKAFRKGKVLPGKGFSSRFHNYALDQRFEKNRYLRFLAITFPSVRGFAMDDQTFVFYFPGRGNIQGGIYVWHFTTKGAYETPKEILMADLWASPKATERLYNYFQRNRNDPLLADLLKLWKPNDFANEYTIRAILDDECILANFLGGGNNCMSALNNQQLAENMEMGPYGLPSCATDKLRTRNVKWNALIEITSNGGQSFGVYSSKTGFQNFLGAYNDLLNQAPDLKSRYLLAATIIICNADCKNKVFEDRSLGYSVFSCTDNVLLLPGKQSVPFHFLLDTISNLTRTTLATDFATQAAYTGSFLARLVKHSVQTDEFYTIVDFAPASPTYNGDPTTSLYSSFLSSSPGVGNRNYLLRSRSDPNKFFWASGSAPFKIEPLPWFTEDHLRFIEIRKLAAWRSDHHTLRSTRNNLSVVTSLSSGGTQLWNFKLSPTTSSVVVRAPLDAHLDPHGRPPHEMSKRLSAYMAKTSLRMIAPLLRATENPDLRVVSFYPDDVRARPGSPITALGTGSSNPIQTVLNGLTRKAKQRIMALDLRSNTLHVLGGTHTPPWFNSLMFSTENIYTSWLYLQHGGNLPVVASESAGLLCFLNTSAPSPTRKLYAWNTIGRGQKPPLEKVLASEANQLPFTGTMPTEYFDNLSAGFAPQEEANIYLEATKLNKSFQVLDFFTLTRGRSSTARALLFHWDTDTTPGFRATSGTRDGTQFIPVSIVNRGPKSWPNIQDRYLETWYRDAIFTQVANITIVPRNQRLWLGPNRFGSLKDNSQVAVFLGSGRRQIGYKSLNSIIYPVAKHKYTYRKAFSTAGRYNDTKRPTTNELFNSWVASRYNENIWRADPIGYFDR